MAAALFQIAVKAVVNYFVDKRQQMQAHRQALKYLRLNGYQQKVDVEYVGAVEPRRRLYGYFRAGGLNCMPAVVTGTLGTRLHKLLAISDGQISSIDGVSFDGTRIAAAAFSGNVITSGTYAGKAQIFPHLGLASQARTPQPLRRRDGRPSTASTASHTCTCSSTSTRTRTRAARPTSWSTGRARWFTTRGSTPRPARTRRAARIRPSARTPR
jgi:hypothetical protein